MGWFGHKLPDTNYQLFTRGGTNGVFIQEVKDDRLIGPEIKISSELLRMLVAEDIRSKAMSRLEQMDTEDLLNLVTPV